MGAQKCICRLTWLRSLYWQQRQVLCAEGNAEQEPGVAALILCCSRPVVPSGLRGPKAEELPRLDSCVGKCEYPKL